MNLFTKILSAVLSTCLIIFIAITGFNLYKANDFAVENAQKIAFTEGEKQAAKVKTELEYTMDTARTMATALKTMAEEEKADRDLANAMLKNVLEENQDFIGAWTAWEPNAFDGEDEKYKGTKGHDDTGRFIPYWNRSDGKINLTALLDYDVSGIGNYYLLAKNSGKEVIIDPYAYPLNGKEILMTSIVTPIKVGEEIVGAVGIDISLEFMQEINDSIKLYESGFGSIISNNGTIVAHKSQDLVGKNQFEIEGTESEQIKSAIESGRTLAINDTSIVTNGEVYKAYSPIRIGSSETPWSLMVEIPIEEVKQQSEELLTLSIIASSIGTIILIMVIIWITRKLVKPILRVVGQIKEVADGNLTVEKLKIKSKDEIGQLAMATNQMTSNMRALIRNAAVIADQVNSYSEELITSTNEMRDGIAQVAMTTEELAYGSSEQAQQASDTLEKIKQVDHEAKQITQLTEVMTVKSKTTQRSSQKGMQSAEESMEQMKLIEEKVSSAAHIVKELDEKSKKINKILEVINNIAEQTNLLALNAAIEAARAGEHGKGFAVVAGEVRKLAEQSAESTGQISTIINTVQKEAEEAEEAMNGVVQEVQSGTKVIAGSRDAFNEIADNIKDMVVQINEVTRASQLIDQETKEAVKAVKNITAISEESSSGSEELSVSMEQQSASMQEIDGMANNLAQMAESLNQSLSKFKYNINKDL